MLIKKTKISINGVEVENAFDLVLTVNRLTLPTRFESQVEFKFEGVLSPVISIKNINKVEIAFLTEKDVFLYKFKKCSFDVQRECLGDGFVYVATLISQTKVKSTHFENAWWAE